MADKRRELEYKLNDFPLVRFNMLNHLAFQDFLEKADNDQLKFCEAFFDDKVDILFNESAAGTGKTMCSVACAYADFLNHQKNLVFIIAPVSEDLGSRPGNQTEKEMAYFMGLHDALQELNIMPEQAITEMLMMEDNVNKDQLSNTWVSQISHLFLRGGNLKNVTVIVNEAQNFTRGEMKKILTRLHSDTKTVVEGNYKQIDLKNKAKSGLQPYYEYFKEYPTSSYHTFRTNHRSMIAQFADELKWD